MMRYFATTVCLVFFVLFKESSSQTLDDGDPCKNGSQQGTCITIRECPWAKDQILQGKFVEPCGFHGKIPSVCCPTTNMNINVTNNAYFETKGKVYDGQISSAKCKEFYPLDIHFAYGGIPSLAQEFPHMAILGYGLESDIQWGCGGSLISLQHVLTAAHCLHSRSFGDVKFVRLGDLDIKNLTDIAEPQDFTVSLATPHPNYDHTTSKHDIAILELDRKIVRSSYVKPACLHIGNPWPKWWGSSITASGWGITEFAGELSSHLMKVDLKILGIEECRRQYVRSGAKSDIDNNTQICADSKDPSRNMDTCEGDSGGPLQIANFTTERHYSILGVTSYGKACGISKSAGVYTRVSYYIPWIEYTIWKDE